MSKKASKSYKPYKKAQLDEYVDLIIRQGINVQPGQQLVINSSVDSAFFARKAMVAAYEAGASNVFMRWNDDFCARAKYLMADDGAFDRYPAWDKLMLDTLSEEGAAFLSITSSDPEAFKGVDSDRLSRWNITASAALKEYYEKAMANQIRWCIAAIPSEAWAKKVFPEASNAEEAEALLWKNIFAATMVGGGNAIEKWQVHVDALKRRVALLDEHHFASLHFKNKAGTDLCIQLPEKHLWQGGGDTAKDGHAFLPNIPTQELFTAPKLNGADGTVVGTIPNVFRGNIIEDFSIAFKDGKVISYDAKIGKEHLEKMITDTPGMDRLGEIALVDHDSPISNTGVLFYNTLFDENASCHLALGSAYADCIEGGADMTEDERRENGLNVSDSHHDFMFGSADMTIMGIKASGEEMPVFANGSFVL